MKIDIISVVPALLESPFAHSIMKRARDKGLLEVNCINLRDHTTYARAQVDDYQFGGGAGMVMMIEPLVNAIESLQKETVYDEIIFLTPDGKTFNQQMANELSLKKNLLLICGHYKGIDQRLRDHFVTREISIGDYVLSGGELAVTEKGIRTSRRGHRGHNERSFAQACRFGRAGNLSLMNTVVAPPTATVAMPKAYRLLAYQM